MPLLPEKQNQIKELVSQCRENLLAQKTAQGESLLNSLAGYLPPNINGKDKHSFIELIRGLLADDKGLASLDLANSTFLRSDEAFFIFAMALRRNSGVITLDLNSCKINDKRAKFLAQALAVNRLLAQLFLSRNEIREAGAVAIMQALASNTTLVDLRLGGNNIGDNGAKALAQVLRLNSTLVILDLWWNSIGDDGAKSIAQALKVNRTLEQLYLWENRIADDGASAIAQALTENHTLAVLYLSHNIIGTVGMNEFSQVLPQNTILRRLVVDMTMSVVDESLLAKNETDADARVDESVLIRTQADFDKLNRKLAEGKRELQPIKASVKKLCLIGTGGQGFLKLLEVTSSSQSNESDSNNSYTRRNGCTLV